MEYRQELFLLLLLGLKDLEQNKMDEQNLFSAGIKIIGFLSFGRGFLDLVSVIMIQLNISSISVMSDSYYSTLRMGLIYLLAGLFVMRFSLFFVSYAFPSKSIINENQDNEDEPLKSND